LQLIAGHLSDADRLAAGLRVLPNTTQSFAAAQAAWRFYSNPVVDLPMLAEPLIEMAKRGIRQTCQDYALLVLDWSLLHYTHHGSKTDRIDLAHCHDLGYKLLTALAVSDVTGQPLAPVCLELEATDGLHSTRSREKQIARSPLDGLSPVMSHVEHLALGRDLVWIVDREADSVQHFRTWLAAKRLFLVRANDTPRAVHSGRSQPLKEIAAAVALVRTREVRHKGAVAIQFAGETQVVLERPARTHRVKNGRKQHHNIAGPAIALRLIVSAIRDHHGRLLARWLLLTNLPLAVSAGQVALWYYWRWEIESYHKLLKQAGQHLESWQQDDAEQLARRLSVVAMAAVWVWQLARDPRPKAEEMRQILVRLSGRQMKRGAGRPSFTEPALLAGMGILLPMLHLLEEHSPDELKRMACEILPGTWSLPASNSG
jgi:hypothetical protein